MKRTTQIILCGIVLLMVGCKTTQKDQEDYFRSKLSVTEWNLNSSPKMTLKVAERVKKVDGFDMGRVILRRTDGFLFSAMVIPMREIPIGQEVKLYEIIYMHNPGTEMGFMVVQ